MRAVLHIEPNNMGAYANLISGVLLALSLGRRQDRLGPIPSP